MNIRRSCSWCLRLKANEMTSMKLTRSRLLTVKIMQRKKEVMKDYDGAPVGSFNVTGAEVESSNYIHVPLGQSKLVGLLLGLSEGEVEKLGESLGLLIGGDEGSSNGISVGIDDGDLDGVSLGITEGDTLSEGEMLGDVVGFDDKDGERLGNSDGIELKDGLTVGNDDGSDETDGDELGVFDGADEMDGL